MPPAAARLRFENRGYPKVDVDWDEEMKQRIGAFVRLFAALLGVMICIGVCGVPERTSAQEYESSLNATVDLTGMMHGLASYLMTLQDDAGAIIDPLIDREHQYSTPYFAAGVAGLVAADKADDRLLQSGIRAMDHATACFASGHAGIPDGHGEFFIASLTQAWNWFDGLIDEGRLREWRERLSTPIADVIESRATKINNWRTYAMNGEWLRAQAGLVSRDDAVVFIEDAWLERTQRERIVSDRWFLYQDWNGDP